MSNERRTERKDEYRVKSKTKCKTGVLLVNDDMRLPLSLMKLRS